MQRRATQPLTHTAIVRNDFYVKKCAIPCQLPLCHGRARLTNNHLLECRLFSHLFSCSSVPIANVRMKQVRYRSHATYSRQPRQVRKEATVTGSCVCSEVPVPDLFSTAYTRQSRNF